MYRTIHIFYFFVNFDKFYFLKGFSISYKFADLAQSFSQYSFIIIFIL